MNGRFSWDREYSLCLLGVLADGMDCINHEDTVMAENNLAYKVNFLVRYCAFTAFHNPSWTLDCDDSQESARRKCLQSQLFPQPSGNWNLTGKCICLLREG